LVEKTTRIRQKGAVEVLMASGVPGVELEYYVAQKKERA